jgi:hypothetical protein
MNLKHNENPGALEKCDDKEVRNSVNDQHYNDREEHHFYSQEWEFAKYSI